MPGVLEGAQWLGILGEFLGTMILILLGNGVCAAMNFKNMFAKKTGGNWVVIIMGWGFAVMAGVIVANSLGSGAHINPAVTMWVLIKGFKVASSATAGFMILNALLYIVAQMLGAITGQIILNFINWKHIKENDSAALKSSSCTAPSHPNAWVRNFSYELVGTLVLVGVLYAANFQDNLADPVNNKFGVLALGPLTVTFLVMGIGLSLGSVTGYAINPARDLGPRLVYSWTKKFALKDPNAVAANYKYCIIVPVLAPMVAGLIMGLFGLIW